MPKRLDHKTVRDELLSQAKRPYATWDCESVRRAALDAVKLLDHYARDPREHDIVRLASYGTRHD